MVLLVSDEALNPEHGKAKCGHATEAKWDLRSLILYARNINSPVYFDNLTDGFLMDCTEVNAESCENGRIAERAS